VIHLLRHPLFVLAAATTILAVTMGVRHGFGLFLPSMSADNGWGREVFAFALAVQNLAWGAAQPFTGMLADRFGAGKAMAGGVLLYTLGLVLMAHTASPGGLVLSAGVLIGLGLSGTTFSVVLGAIGRAVPPEKRSVALGIGAAIGSFGQFAMLPLSLSLIQVVGWSAALLALAGLTALMLPLSAAVVERPSANKAEADVTVRQALGEAAAHRGFWLLCFGFFVSRSCSELPRACSICRSGSSRWYGCRPRRRQHDRAAAFRARGAAGGELRDRRAFPAVPGSGDRTRLARGGARLRLSSLTYSR
jgi:MFS family permease